MRINGAALKTIRERSGLSTTAAAERAGVSSATWSLWESGRRNVTPKNLQRIREVLVLEDVTAILAGPHTSDPVAS